jgi:predicted nucleic acid-binding Zn finger protein
MIPQSFAQALNQRMREARKVVSSYRFARFNGGYKVVGGRADYFLSSQEGGRCTCPDYLLTGREAGCPCKHILAARKLGLF